MNEIEKLLIEANKYYNEKNYDKAIECYDKAIELDPKNSAAYNGLGNVYFNLQRYDEAIKDYNKAIELDPNFSEAYYNRGNVYSDLEKYDEAIKDYDKAIELNPNYSNAYNNRGNTYSALKNYDEAIKDYNKAIELNPNYSNAYNNRGNVYYNLQRYDEAIKDYNKAIELNPNYSNAYNNRGNVYYNLQRYDEAIRDYNKAIELNPKNSEAYYNRGNVYYNLQRYDEAIKDYNKAIELNPNYSNAYNNRGNVYFNLQRYDEAIKDYNKAIELNPNYSNAYNNRGLAYYNRGIAYYALGRHDEAIKNYDEAIKDYDTVIKLNPNYSAAYYNRGLAYTRLEKYNEAIACYKEAFDLEIKSKSKITDYIFHYINVASENFDLDYIIDKLAENTKIPKLTIYEYILLYFLTLKEDDEVKSVAYYTSTRALEKLIKEEEEEENDDEKKIKKISSVRMSTLSKVNDPDEGKVLLKILNKYTDIEIKEEIKKDGEYAVQTSFTRCVDSLTMFRLYGKTDNLEGTGVSLVFKKKFFDTTFQYNELPNQTTKTTDSSTSIDIGQSSAKNNKQPLYYVMYYDEATNELVFNPHKSNYKNIIINLEEKELDNYKNFKYPINAAYGNTNKDYYKNIENNIGYIFKTIFGIIKENKEIHEGLKNIKYLIKNAAFVEEQELRVLKVLKSDDLDIDHEIKSVYKNYFEAVANNALEQIILGSKINNVQAVEETWAVYIEQQAKKDSRYNGIKVSVSKAPFN